MDVKITRIKKEIIIGGFSIETSPENNERDLEVLFNDFYNGKMDLLNSFSKNSIEYYGIIWHTELHERYKYLIGQNITNELTNFNGIRIRRSYKDLIFSKLVKINKPAKFEWKEIPNGTYAYASFAKDIDSIKAWTNFNQTGIPEIGYRPKEKDAFAFKYYPNGLHDKYELWSLVEENARVPAGRLTRNLY